MMSWIKGLFGRPTKSEVIRDTILTLAKQRGIKNLTKTITMDDLIREIDNQEESRKARKRVYQRQYRLRKKQEQKGNKK